MSTHNVCFCGEKKILLTPFIWSHGTYTVIRKGMAVLVEVKFCRCLFFMFIPRYNPRLLGFRKLQEHVLTISSRSLLSGRFHS